MLTLLAIVSYSANVFDQYYCVFLRVPAIVILVDFVDSMISYLALSSFSDRTVRDRLMIDAVYCRATTLVFV